MANVGTLGKRVAANVQKLARLEAQLVAEAAKPQLQRAGMSVGFGLTALLIAHLAVIFLLLAASAALALVVPVWAALLIVGGSLMIVAAILVLAARRGIEASTPVVPPQTIERVKQDVQWVREQTS
jgi:Putative Actinobacterial Holin-X, holin superfamily III